MIDRIPETGRVLVTGPSNVGKTRTTARALECWVETHGPEDVVVLDFAPELERDGDVLGGRLDRFTTVPETAWVGALEARAPRAESETPDGARSLARENADGAMEILEAMPPKPAAVFVNDVTIPFQHAVGDLKALFARCSSASLVVMNAFDSDELGVDDSVSVCESETLEALEMWVDERVRLE